MGTVCSMAKTNSVVNADGSTAKGSTEPESQTQYSISASILCSPIWNPFRISREEAEILLQTAFPGAFVFSHSITSEIFLSVSTGKYVCHHPILKFSQHFQIGGRAFSNVEAAVVFYRNNPLGDAVLTEQYNPLRNNAHDSRTELSSKLSKAPSSTTSCGGLPDSSPPKSKRVVTFDTGSPKPSQQQTSTSIDDEQTVTNDALSPKVTRVTTLVDSEVNLDKQQEELFKKIRHIPRKSICRIQPEDSLSTSSENMFVEEEI